YHSLIFDFDAVLTTIRVMGAEDTNKYVDTESDDEGKPTIIMRHGMGMSASAYYGASFNALCHRLGLKVDLEESDDQLIFKIRRVSREQSLVQSRSAQKAN